MPPKKDKAKAAGGKAGRPMKDVLPPNVKPPREGQPIKPVEQPAPDAPPPTRSYTYSPYPIFPQWPGNQAAKEHDFQVPDPPQQLEAAQNVPRPFVVQEEECYTDETPIYLPPSFFDFERKNIQWCRPHQFLKLSAIEEEFRRVKEEKRTQFRRKSIAVTNTLKGLTSIGGGGGMKQTSHDDLNLNSSEQADAGDYASRVSKLSKEKIAQINVPFDISVINYKQRDQTPEQMKRRKEQAEKQAAADKTAKKKAPPAPKKGAAADAQQQQPLKVKQAIINSMDMGVGMPMFSKWATSQLQVIKDRSIRDCMSKEQAWQRIYPQTADGIPKYNPKGKYWIKIHIFGKERLIEIDDRMPCDNVGRLLLPRSSNQYQIWPMLLMKAILKAYSYKYMRDTEKDDELVGHLGVNKNLFDTNLEPQVGDGMIIHSLTGLIPERISLWDRQQAKNNPEGKQCVFFNQSWQRLNQIMSDEHYFKKLTYAVVYCDPEYTPSLPSMKKPSEQSPKVYKIDSQSGQQIFDKKDPSQPSSPVKVGEFTNSPGAPPLIPQPSSIIQEVPDQVNQILSKKAVQKANPSNPQSQLRTLNRLRTAANIAISVTTGKKLNVSNKQRPSYVIPGFGYALLDIFENKFVDMTSIIPKDQDDFKSPFSPKKKKLVASLTKQQREELKRKKKQARRAARDEEKLFEQTKLPKQYKLIKIKSSLARYPVINTICPFTNQQIRTAKKCLLNSWSKPPQAGQVHGTIYDPDDPHGLKRQGRYQSPDAANAGAGFSLSLQPTQSKQQQKQEVKQQEEQQQQKGSQAEKQGGLGVKQPRTRAPGGIWLQASDFPHCFQHILIFHNPDKFKNKLILNDIWENVQQTYINDQDGVFIEVKSKQQEGQQNQHQMNQTGVLSPPTSAYGQREQSGMLVQNRNHSLFFGYMPYYVNRWHKVPPKPRFAMNLITIPGWEYGDSRGGGIVGVFGDKYLEGRFLRDVSLNMITDKNDDTLSSMLLKADFYNPMGYVAWVCSNMQLRKMTRIEYLVEQLNYKHKQYTIQPVNVQSKSYHIFGKYDIKVPQNQDAQKKNCNVYIRLTGQDKYLLDYIRFKLYNRNQDEYEENQNIARTECGGYQIYNRQEFETHLKYGGNYMLMIESFLPYTLFTPPNATDLTPYQLHLDVVNEGQSQVVVEPIEGLDPLEYVENYAPNNQGVLFREKIYVADKNAASFLLEVTRDPEPVKEEQQQENKEEEERKEKGEEEEIVEEDKKKEERKFPIYFQIFDHKTLVRQVRGTNGSVLISHFVFRSNAGLPDPIDPSKAPQENQDPNIECKHSYTIQARFDLCEFPQSIEKSEENQRLKWSLKVYSQDTLAVVKDTEKQDSEKALKASWEQNEPGRAERAKKSRTKYLAHLKKQNGQELTQEEEELLKEPWFKPKKQQILDPKAAAKAKKDAGKKPPDKGKKGAAPDPSAQQQQKPEKPFPKSTNHTNHEIIQFLQHFESERMLKVKTGDSRECTRKRTEEQLSTILELRRGDIEKQMREIQQMVKGRQEHAEKREKFRQDYNRYLLKQRQQYRAEVEKIMQKRNGYREMISTRKEKEKNLLELIGADKKDIALIEKALEQAKENLVKEQVLKQGESVLEQLKYWKSIEDALREAMAEKNGDEMRARIAQIENEAIPLEPKLLTDAKNQLAKMK